MAYDISDPSLAPSGMSKILWADNNMTVLRQVRQQFESRQPFLGYRIGACLHVTAETANLMRTLKAGGAEVALCASNPLSTQDDIAAALATELDIPVFARRGEDNITYYKHINAVLDSRPHLTLDDGADLISELHKKRKEQLPEVIGGTEQTTTGVTRLSSMARNGVLQFPVMAVNNAKSKYLFDNRYGTGQSTIDALMRSTNILLAGKNMVVCGYGWCGKGVAMRARGLGAIVIVVEVNPLHALEAAMDGFFVTHMDQAAQLGDIFITATGDLNVIRRKHFAAMKDAAILCNAGHFNSEIEIQALEELASHKEEVRPLVDCYHLPDKRLYLLAQGRLINLSCGDGHPASVMDMSFANQALSLEHLVKHHRQLDKKVYPVPTDIDEEVALMKLQGMGIELHLRTREQEDYQLAWELGT
ncbi:MAG: adenosylhomocysteinase [Candidatus Sericytochromatia bacterium]|nr:adenosylhomocysteinase [Candidatus Sericytochromatia bacterium]